MRATLFLVDVRYLSFTRFWRISGVLSDLHLWVSLEFIFPRGGRFVLVDVQLHDTFPGFCHLQHSLLVHGLLTPYGRSMAWQSCLVGFFLYTSILDVATGHVYTW